MHRNTILVNLVIFWNLLETIDAISMTNSGFNREVQQVFPATFFSPCCLALPRSGCVLQPRVAAAATLGLKLNVHVNRNAVVAGGRNPFRVGNHLLANPGLKQPWAIAVTALRYQSKPGTIDQELHFEVESANDKCQMRNGKSSSRLSWM
jgi:hypothetical protein